MRRLLFGIVVLLPLSIGAAASADTASRQEFTVQTPSRLSAWLLNQTSVNPLSYDTAVNWLSSTQQAEQESQVEALKGRLAERSLMAAGDPLGAARLRRLVDALPYRGRVALPSADARWLEANPAADPMLAAGDKIVTYGRPKTVTVVMSSGQICHVEHSSGQPARAYAQTCLSVRGNDRFSRSLNPYASGPVVWIAQPDGQLFQAHVESHLDPFAPEPAPGAWVWVPEGWIAEDAWFAKTFAELLAAQGPAGDYIRFVQTQPVASVVRKNHYPVSRSQWGSVGLIQMPTARMAPEGEFAISRTLSDPYRRVNVMIQGMPWLEYGLRYTDIRNRLYGPASFSGDQTYIDKSLDVKFRLVEENDLWPQISIGMIDAVGTGLFSSEYIVASKRFGAFDFTGGLAFGVLGAGGNFSNPMGLLKDSYKARRQNDVGMGGMPGFKSWFTGPMSPFVGVEWATPWPKWSAKLEYSANDGSKEPYLGGTLYTPAAPTSRFNYGLVYRLTDWVDLSVGVERGYQVIAGITLHPSLNKGAVPKILDAPPVAVVPLGQAASVNANQTSHWRPIAKAIEQATLWEIEVIEQRGSDLVVRFLKTDGPYMQDRIELIGRILNRDAPQFIQRFLIDVSTSGLPVTRVVIDRKRFVQDRTTLVPPVIKRDSPAVQEQEPKSSVEQPGDVVYDRLERRHPGDFAWGHVSTRLGSSYSHLLGGPTGFWLFQFGLQAQAEWRPFVGTWAELTANYRLIDNYNNFYNNPVRNLPPVRTYLRNYYDGDRFTLRNVQATHVGRIGGPDSNHFYSVYGGMLEIMFGGVGVEYLYRPWRSPLAFGLDVNSVKQRDFDQKFGFMQYSVNTGHATMYWDTGWNGVLVKTIVGQYLAGDRGVTLDISRTFKSGVTIGGLATKTNVSAAEFGEGSFDKMLYLQIPFDLILPKRSNVDGGFAWRNLTSNAGAMLIRKHTLYGLTEKRDPRALEYGTQ